MDLSTLFLGTVMTLLPLAGAGLLAAMVLLERPGTQLAAAPAQAGQVSKTCRPRQRRAPAPGGQRRKA